MKVSIHNFGCFKLDGGSMFGAVPKNLWSKIYPVDDQNRIRLATNSLIIEDQNRVFLIDVGCGDKWSSNLSSIYGVEPINWLPHPDKITDIILTHLHFDHAGGISRKNNDQLELVYPQAKVFLQSENYQLAKNPNIRERASYLEENVLPLEKANLELLSGEKEIYPGISVHPINGHTAGQQWIKINTGSEVYVYPSDLVPTSRHLPLAYHMGYDLCVRKLIEEKRNFLKLAAQNQWKIVFQHDPDFPVAQIKEVGVDRWEII